MTNRDMIDDKIVMLPKWNYEAHRYEPYKSYCGVGLMRETMDTPITCAGCGKEVKFGDTYSSMAIHSRLGLGYAVCDECHQKEWEERRKHKEDD